MSESRSVCVRGSAAATKTPSPNKSGRKGFIWLPLPGHSFIAEDSQGRNLSRAGTWMRELMQMRWRAVVYWFASHGLLSLFSYRTQNYQSRVVPLTWLGLLHQSLIKKMPYSQILWTCFLDRSFSFQITLAWIKLTEN